MLTITPRPRGGDWLEVDVAALSVRGVNLLVSLLESDEAAELGLVDESVCCTAHGIEFLSLPVQDLGVPRDSTTFGSLLRRPSRAIGIVCARAGLPGTMRYAHYASDS